MGLPPAPNSISMDQIRLEAGIPQAGANLNNGTVRSLAGRPGDSTAISFDDLRGKSAYTAMTVIGNDDEITDYSTGMQYTQHLYPSVSVSGGSGGYTYLWSFITQNGAVLVTSTGQTADVSHVISKFGYQGSCVLQCVVTDNTGHQVTVSNIYATWTIYDSAAP